MLQRKISIQISLLFSIILEESINAGMLIQVNTRRKEQIQQKEHYYMCRGEIYQQTHSFFLEIPEYTLSCCLYVTKLTSIETWTVSKASEQSHEILLKRLINICSSKCFSESNTLENAVYLKP